MSLFRMPKPRGFRHNYIYYDERRERLRAIEERARRELGMEPPEEFCPEHLRGVFAGSTSHLRRARERRSAGRPQTHVAVLVFLLIALIALVRYLL